MKCLEVTSYPQKKCSNSHLEEQIFVSTIQASWLILFPSCLKKNALQMTGHCRSQDFTAFRFGRISKVKQYEAQYS